MKDLSIFMALALSALCLGAGIKVSRKHRRLLAALFFLVVVTAFFGAEVLADKHYPRQGAFAFFAICGSGILGYAIAWKKSVSQARKQGIADQEAEQQNLHYLQGYSNRYDEDRSVV